MTKACEDCQISYALCVNLAEAFEEVPHIPVIRKPENSSVIGLALEILPSLLNAETSNVRVGCARHSQRQSFRG